MGVRSNTPSLPSQGRTNPMEPYSPRFGGGATQTVLHPLVLVAMLLAAILFFVLPRKYMILPVLFATFLIPLGQQFVIAGVHLFVGRILMLLALVALKSRHRGPLLAGGWNSIDTAFAAYVLITAVATMVLYPDASALVNQVGYLWDYLVGYLVVRGLVRNKKDSFLAIKCFAVLVALLSIAMAVEQVRRVNSFSFLGGVKSVLEVREDKVRSQAIFQHPLTAGAFAATAMPLFFLLWRNGKAKALATIGIVGATVMTLTTQTSTSLLTYAAGIVPVFFWPLRKKMKTLRWTALILLISLHLVMKAPVWFLIARIDLTGSSSSYQRAELIDQCVNHFSSWWLIGTKEAASWGWDMWDAQNMYVSVGEAGGLAALVFYLLVISRAFGKLGDARKRAAGTKEEWFFWLLGTAVFANVVAFFGVNYYDQVRMAWFALLAMVCACTVPFVRPKIELTEHLADLPGIPTECLINSSPDDQAQKLSTRLLGPSNC